MDYLKTLLNNTTNLNLFSYLYSEKRYDNFKKDFDLFFSTLLQLKDSVSNDIQSPMTGLDFTQLHLSLYEGKYNKNRKFGQTLGDHKKENSSYADLAKEFIDYYITKEILYAILEDGPSISPPNETDSSRQADSVIGSPRYFEEQVMAALANCNIKLVGYEDLTEEENEDTSIPYNIGNTNSKDFIKFMQERFHFCKKYLSNSNELNECIKTLVNTACRLREFNHAKGYNRYRLFQSYELADKNIQFAHADVEFAMRPHFYIKDKLRLIYNTKSLKTQHVSR